MYKTNNYDLIKLNNRNLVDLSTEELSEFINKGYWLLPTDELDIRFCNNLDLQYDKVMLPRCGKDIINYFDYVPKNSKFYDGLSKNTDIVVPKSNSYSISEFKNLHPDEFNPCAIKTVLGSGSRGVIVYNPDHYASNTREQVKEIKSEHLNKIIDHANQFKCNIIVQDLCRVDLRKACFTVIMRKGNLLGYLWSEPTNPSTNWDYGKFVRTEFTDYIVNQFVKYLKKLGITDCMIGFDGYSDYESYIDCIEVNWRQENCFFMWEAFQVDFINTYINNIDINNVVPYGFHDHVRYWRCGLINDLIK